MQRSCWKQDKQSNAGADPRPNTIRHGRAKQWCKAVHLLAKSAFSQHGSGMSVRMPRPFHADAQAHAPGVYLTNRTSRPRSMNLIATCGAHMEHGMRTNTQSLKTQ